jgi:predicted AAA+ superfamily ATPase
VRQLLEVKDLTLFLRGHIFETFVVSETRKLLLPKGSPASLYFWRDSGGTEIDLLVEESGFLLPIEIKAGETLTPDFFTGLQKWMSLAGHRVVHPTLVYGGAEDATFKGIRVLGWSSVPAIYPEICSPA